MAIRRDDRPIDPDVVPGNLLSAMGAALPVNLDRPADRLRAVAASTSRRGHWHRALGDDLLADLVAVPPPVVLSALVRVYRRLRLDTRLPPIFNAIVSNVPGPSVPLYCSGAHLGHRYLLGRLVGRRRAEPHRHQLRGLDRHRHRGLSRRGRRHVGDRGRDGAVPRRARRPFRPRLIPPRGCAPRRARRDFAARRSERRDEALALRRRCGHRRSHAPTHPRSARHVELENRGDDAVAHRHDDRGRNLDLREPGVGVERARSVRGFKEVPRVVRRNSAIVHSRKLCGGAGRRERTARSGAVGTWTKCPPTLAAVATVPSAAPIGRASATPRGNRDTAAHKTSPATSSGWRAPTTGPPVRPSSSRRRAPDPVLSSPSSIAATSSAQSDNRNITRPEPTGMAPQVGCEHPELASRASRTPGTSSGRRSPPSRATGPASECRPAPHLADERGAAPAEHDPAPERDRRPQHAVGTRRELRILLPQRRRVRARCRGPGRHSERCCRWLASGGLNWFRVFETLGRCRVLAPNGPVAMPHGAPTARCLPIVPAPDDVAALLGELRTGPVLVAGYSMGGPVALLLRAAPPRAGRRTCLVCRRWSRSPRRQTPHPIGARSARSPPRREWRALGSTCRHRAAPPRFRFAARAAAQLPGVDDRPWRAAPRHLRGALRARSTPTPGSRMEVPTAVAVTIPRPRRGPESPTRRGHAESRVRRS